MFAPWLEKRREIVKSYHLFFKDYNLSTIAPTLMAIIAILTKNTEYGLHLSSKKPPTIKTEIRDNLRLQFPKVNRPTKESTP